MFIKTKKLTSTATAEGLFAEPSIQPQKSSFVPWFESTGCYSVYMYGIISLIFEAFAKILTERVAWGNLMHISIVLKPAGHYFFQ